MTSDDLETVHHVLFRHFTQRFVTKSANKQLASGTLCIYACENERPW